ncbi:Gfo/Idh/MocA family oxidoreductase [Paenibacillus sp. GD4]|uniref:Gfo/Idh/MocA family protein n=1 Tax=Paenibacillus sp. GD4 TaxID=3068890 RepID=UPI002796CACC|nr:Gfo/Idh/MocA family oxidoreductase [Paenibacillus sp. GD4]MDQ1912804.1 Gfo/Idh/MocA family oxidoreductase [Paenibacillus sp. GD4]
MNKLKLGLVGTGNIVKNAHMPGWSSHPEIEIAAVCDTNKQLAEAFATEFGIMAVYSDYRDLLKRDDIDVIGIGTPNLFHSEVAIAALQAGKHVFCEKPDAINPEEAEKMAAAAKQSGKVLMVMRNNRFRAVSRFLKTYADKGHMGEIYTGRCGWIRRRGIPGRGGWFTTKALSGGGPLIDLGVHMIDLAIWIMGNPKPIAVSGAAYNKFAGESEEGTFDVEDLASGFIRFDNGATLQIEFSWASNIGEDQRFVELRGTKSGFSLIDDQVKLYTEIEGVLCNVEPVFPAKDPNGHTVNIHHFVDVVLGKAEPIFTPDQGVDMIKILDAIYESAKQGKEVTLH